MTNRSRILIADADADARRRLRLPRREDDEPVPLILPADDDAPAEAAPALRGSLSLMSLSALLNHVAAERLTGLLALNVEALEGRALLECRDGSLTRARLRGTAFPRNADLVYALLPLAGGSFEFRPFPVDGADEIEIPIPALLLEGARRADEDREPSGSNPDRPSRTESGSPGGSTM